MKKRAAAGKRITGLALAVMLFLTGQPLGAFAAAAGELCVPASPPLEHPAPVDYEAMLGLKDDADGAGRPAGMPPVSDGTGRPAKASPGADSTAVLGAGRPAKAPPSADSTAVLGAESPPTNSPKGTPTAEKNPDSAAPSDADPAEVVLHAERAGSV